MDTRTFDGGLAGTATEPSLGSRVLALPYGGLCYLLGVAGLGWLALTLAGVVAWPGVLDVGSRAGAVLVDLALVSMFGLSHTVMARSGFKTWWTRVIPPWAERSTYVLFAGAMLAMVVVLWQPLPEPVWWVGGGVAAVALWLLCALGWAYMLAATFAIDQFDLFGLRQSYLHAVGRPYEPVPFKRRWMYRYSRHPIMAGVLVGVWATPHMTLGHLVLAAALSGYIAVGLWFEERDLVARFGERYRRYRVEVGALLSLPGRGRR